LGREWGRTILTTKERREHKGFKPRNTRTTRNKTGLTRTSQRRWGRDSVEPKHFSPLSPFSVGR
jgi:hypothetical protein